MFALHNICNNLIKQYKSSVISSWPSWRIKENQNQFQSFNKNKQNKIQLVVVETKDLFFWPLTCFPATLPLSTVWANCRAVWEQLQQPGPSGIWAEINLSNASGPKTDFLMCESCAAFTDVFCLLLSTSLTHRCFLFFFFFFLTPMSSCFLHHGAVEGFVYFRLEIK